MKRRNINKYLFIVFIIIFIIYIAFNFYHSINSLSIASKTELYDLGLCNNEFVVYGFSHHEYDRFGKLFRWSEKMSELIVRAEGKDAIVISLFNPKPDIESQHIKIKVFLDDEEIYEIIQAGNEPTDIEIDISGKDIVKGDFINLKFISSESWVPKEYGISDDTREISFALREIKFVD